MPAIGPDTRRDHVAGTAQVRAPYARAADPTAVHLAAAAAVPVAPRGSRFPAAAQPSEMPDIPARGPAEPLPVPARLPAELPPVPVHPPAMPRPQPLPPRQATVQTAPAVSVRIGRVEVRSVPATEPAPPPAAPPRSTGVQGFDSYLALRSYTGRDY